LVGGLFQTAGGLAKNIIGGVAGNAVGGLTDLIAGKINPAKQYIEY